MAKAIRHGLGNLFNIQGRDARQAFWYYVLFLYIITVAVSMVVTIPVMIQAVVTGVEQGISQGMGSDPLAAQKQAEAAIVSSMSGAMRPVIWTAFGTSLFLLLGLAAALVRRAHDSDLPGWWAAIPIGLQAVSIAFVPSQIANIEQTMAASMSSDPMAGMQAMQQSVNIGSVAGWLAIIAVIVLGVRKSSEGVNRFGDAPFTA